MADTLRELRDRIVGFDRLCAEAEYTDTDDAWQLLRDIQAGLTAALEAPPRTVGIRLEGGLVQSVFSDQPEGLAYVVIDYDTDGADESELSLVAQDDGSEAEAFVTDGMVEKAPIPTYRDNDADEDEDDEEGEDDGQDTGDVLVTARFADRHGELREWSGKVADEADALRRLRKAFPGASKIDLKVYR